ncbi:cupredoxin domain-containing protein [Alicyclobacillus cycloheptanicus]|uniref:Plastocyanin n=1 Tax=Alicyclobacillus cycloheptanicus TaxID=1457 RepID=A0ABT9XFP9_9BACL|nr:cupredoxin domain-containing protein [Alicyclobacillus cycloheptanicus]MDQ0188899.1 plastocyanin [Alicyclobacillus cycloheptanicus]WDM01747.1 cupredoxin domain-containing protein [Alicyclobacillus cycloheptanicus]
MKRVMRLGLGVGVSALCLAGTMCVTAPTYANPATHITLRDGQITPAAFTAKRGSLVEIEVVNRGTKRHNLVIPDFYIFTQNLNPGEDVTASFRPDKTGTFRYYSDVNGQPEPGMQGTLTVTP